MAIMAKNGNDNNDGSKEKKFVVDIADIITIIVDYCYHYDSK